MSKLRFKNVIGKVYDDKIAIGTTKFSYNDFKTINLIKIRDKKYNYIALVIGSIFIVISFTNYDKIAVLVPSLLFSFALILFNLVHHKKKYYLIIDLITTDEKNTFKIKKEQKEEAKNFIKAATSHKTVLKILKEVNNKN